MITKLAPSMLAWHASGDQLIVRPCIAADRTKSGLFLPDEHRELPQVGLVLDAGPGLTSTAGLPIPVLHRVGDLVAYGKYAGSRLHLENDVDEVLLMRDCEVLAHQAIGAFELVIHTIEDRGVTREVFHQVTDTCEHCPREPSSAFLAAERARLGRGDGTGEP